MRLSRFQGYHTLSALFIFIVTSCVIVYLVNHHHLLFAGTPFTDRLPLVSITKNAVGTDYYAELARSFINGKTYFLGPYNPLIYSHPNPYGMQAFLDNVIIQDASFYNGKYYTYYGPVPALFYVFVWLITQRLPTDNLMIAVTLITINLFVLLFVYRLFLSKTFSFTLALTAVAVYVCIFFNPLYLLIYRDHTTALVARLFAVFLFGVGFLTLAEIFRDKFPKSRWIVFAASSVMSLSMLCKANFILDCVIVSIFFCCVLLQRGRKVLLDYAPVLLPPTFCALSVLCYNYIRFDSPFQNGLKYITNSIDYFHGAKFFHFPQNPAYFVYLLCKKTYEYFFIPFSIDGGGRLVADQSGYPFVGNPELYTAGSIGFFVMVPILGFLIWKLFNIFRTNGFSFVVNFENSLVILALLLFFMHFGFALVLALQHFWFAPEFVPFLAYVLVIKRSNLIRIIDQHKWIVVLLLLYSTVLLRAV